MIDLLKNKQMKQYVLSFEGFIALTKKENNGEALRAYEHYINNKFNKVVLKRKYNK